MGGVTRYDPVIADEICERIARGESLSDVCRDNRMPSRGTIWHWIDDDREGFAGRYARARDLQLERWADELLSIADDGTNDWMLRNGKDDIGWQLNGEHVQRAKLRSDNRKWLLSKLRPDRYGDRVVHAGDDAAPVQIVERIELVPVKPKLRDE